MNQGVDISNNNNVTSWSALRQFTNIVIHKATQGISEVDSLLKARYPLIVGNNFKIGYYCFLDKTGSPETQAQHFLDTISGLTNNTVLWLDIEDENTWDEPTAISWANAWINYVVAKGHRTGIYTGLAFYNDYLKGNIINNNVWWLASYPNQPSYYPSSASWQYSETGSINGVTGKLDLDYFLDDIFVNGTVTPQSVKPTPAVPSDTVKTMQRQLNAMTNNNLTITGLNDAVTVAGINQFETIMGLSVDGVWGQSCVDCVNQIYALPPCGIPYTQPSATRLIQFRLGIQYTGIFEQTTKNTVVAWQKANNITENGVFGGKSWNYLLNGIKPAIPVAPVAPVVVKPVVPVVAPLATIEYATYVQNIGLQGFVSNDEIAGTVGQGLRIEALTINYIGKGVLTFQVYLQGTGWQPVVSNGQMAGTLGQGLRVEAVKIFLIGSPMTLTYSVEVENQGWQPYVGSGVQAGTTGLGLRMEAIKIKLS